MPPRIQIHHLRRCRLLDHWVIWILLWSDAFKDLDQLKVAYWLDKSLAHESRIVGITSRIGISLSLQISDRLVDIKPLHLPCCAAQYNCDCLVLVDHFLLMRQKYAILRLPYNDVKQILHLLYQSVLLELVSLPVQEYPLNEKDHNKGDHEVSDKLKPCRQRAGVIIVPS